MTGPETVRAHGCNLRATILNAHTNFGDRVGLQVLSRMAYEIAANGSEIHGKERMAELLYKAADRLVEGAGPPVVIEPEPHVIDLVTVEDALGEQNVSAEPDQALTSSRAPAKWSNRVGLIVAGAAGVLFMLRKGAR